MLAAAVVTAVGTIRDVGAAGSSVPSSFIPIVPCRLTDTRADSTVGSRAVPLGPAESVVLAVWGTNGNCSIPPTATGIATNVTIDNPTADSYVTVYPADADPRPTASNLNFTGASSPTPNQVTVGLSAAGAIAVYNNGGSVDVIVDIVGYYEAASVGATGPQGPPGPPGPAGGFSGGTVSISGWSAIALSNVNIPFYEAGGCALNNDLFLPVELPVGAHITSVAVYFKQGGPSGSTQISLWRSTRTGALVETLSSNVAAALYQQSPATLVPVAGIPAVSSAVRYYIKFDVTNGVDSQHLCGADVTYTM